MGFRLESLFRQWPVIDHAIEAASERQIAVAPLSLIAVQSQNPMLARGPALPISVGGRRHERAMARFRKAT
jgi:hypothetical protein